MQDMFSGRPTVQWLLFTLSAAAVRTFSSTILFTFPSTYCLTQVNFPVPYSVPVFSSACRLAWLQPRRRVREGMSFIEPNKTAKTNTPCSANEFINVIPYVHPLNMAVLTYQLYCFLEVMNMPITPFDL